MKRLVTACMFVFCCLLPGTEARPDTIAVDGYAARVNNRVITVGEVMAALHPIERQLRTTYSGQELANRIEAAYRQALSAMIENALILEEFDQKEGQIPGQLVDEHIQGIISDTFNGDRSEFMRQLALEGISMEEWRRDVRDRLAVMLLRQQEVIPNVVVSPRQVRQAYEERMDEFTQPGGARVRMIMISREPSEDVPDPDGHARRVQEEAMSGADFAELARTHSQDGRAQRGGDWGLIDPAILRPELAQTVHGLEVDQISEIIETPDAFYIVTVEDRKPPAVTPFAEVRDQLTQKVRMEEEQRIYRAWINRLEERFHVHIYPLPRSELDF